MDLQQLHPRAVNLVLFEWAYNLHQAAGETTRISHPRNESGAICAMHQASAQQQQRTGILQIASKLMILERDKLLDQFCVAWLKYRNIPLPERDNGEDRPDPMGLRSPSGPDAGVQASVRESEVQAGEVHDRSAATGAQPSGGNNE
jgi:hypothetical protein